MHCACCIELSHFVNVVLSTHVNSVPFLVRFNNFDQTMGFYCSYTLYSNRPFLYTHVLLHSGIVGTQTMPRQSMCTLDWSVQGIEAARGV